MHVWALAGDIVDASSMAIATARLVDLILRRRRVGREAAVCSSDPKPLCSQPESVRSHGEPLESDLTSPHGPWPPPNMA